MTTIGLAMIARNSADYMTKALLPFMDTEAVDQIAIVLGGTSTDKTAAVARYYADTVADYDGPTDENGGLLDFARARQQSFDLLSTDWALVVDTDDIWQDAHKLPELIPDLDNYHGVMFPYDLGLSRLIQPRLYRRSCGEWCSPVHEYWRYNLPDDDVRILTTDLLTLRQEQTSEKKANGIRRNIRIAEYTLKQNPFNFRLLFHLSREYLLVGKFKQGLDAADYILANLAKCKERDKTPDKMFQLHYMRGMAYLHLDQHEQAAGAAIMALHYAKFGDGWSLLAQIAYNLGLSDLVMEASDLALRYGQPVTGIPVNVENTTVAPYHLKALTLAELDRPQEALAAAEIGLKLGNSDSLKNLKYQLCNQLGTVPQ